MEIPPGGRIATERTRDAEVLFIVAGTSQITVRDAVYGAAPGAGLGVPLGAGYAVSNTSPEQDLRLVCATVRV
jgi:mannose-6-phosphate isomerase-like protein (cupin superfamily)